MTYEDAVQAKFKGLLTLYCQANPLDTIFFEFGHDIHHHFIFN
jgi:hypothetical protein